MNILVTGGTRGIGKAIVERFCSEGHSVAFIYKESTDAARELVKRTGSVAIKCDKRGDYACKLRKNSG